MKKPVLLASVAFAAFGLAGLPTTAALAQTVPASPASDPTAYEDATQAYAAYAAGDHATAARLAGRAVAAEPGNLEWRLLWVDSLMALQDHGGALAALQPVRETWDHRVQSRRGEAARLTGDMDQAAEAYGMGAALAPTAESRAYLSRAQILALTEAGRDREARAALEAAYQSGILPHEAPIDFAYTAVAVGADGLAVEAFAQADQQQALSGNQALDAAYAARRAGRDLQAVTWLERGARTLPPEQMTPQRRHEIGRELQSLEHRFGGTATVSTGPGLIPDGVFTNNAGNVVQAGGEVWARIGGDNNGRPVQLFARAYQTLDADAGFEGSDTTQGWVGVRWKPITETNLILEASRMIAIGDLARDDTMLRVAWSGNVGGDMRFDRDAWPSSELYLDVSHLVEAEQTYAVAQGNIGWTWVTSDSRRDLVTAGVGFTADYDETRSPDVAVSAGPRVAWRHWMGGDDVRAPGQYLDLSIGYYVPLGDNPRDDGFVAALTFGF